MFKRRSSKDLSAKIGYDHVTAKPSKKITELAAPASNNNIAPVGSIMFAASGVPSLQSSSSRRASGTSAGGGTPPTVPTTATGASPVTSMVKSLPPPTHSSPTKVVAVAVVSKASSSAAPSKTSSKSSAPAKVPQEPPSKSLVIGEGVLFEGTTEGCAAAIVGGKLRGTVKTRRLEITKAGRMEGSAFAETAEIAGVFEGKLDVTKSLKICSTGRFKGDVSFGSIVVENGGKLEGKVNYGGCRSPMPESSADAKKAAPAAADTPADADAPVVEASTTTTEVVEPTEEVPEAAVVEVEPAPEVVEKEPEVVSVVVEAPAQSPE